MRSLSEEPGTEVGVAPNIEDLGTAIYWTEDATEHLFRILSTKISADDDSRYRLEVEISKLGRKVNELEMQAHDRDVKIDKALADILDTVKDIRKGQEKQVAIETRISETCSEAESLREKYRTARPTKLSDLVGLLNDYVEDEDQYRKDELDE